MAVQVLAVVGAVANALGILDFFLGQKDDADTSAQLTGLSGQVQTLGAQTLGISLAKVDTSRDNLLNLPTIPSSLQAQQKLSIISDASEGLNGVLNQTGAIISSNTSSAESLITAILSLNYATLHRMNVSAQIEAGPVGSIGGRAKIIEAKNLLDTAVNLLSARIDDNYAVAVSKVNPPVIAIPFVRPGESPSIEVTAVSDITGERSTSEFSISTAQFLLLPVNPTGIAEGFVGYATSSNAAKASLKVKDLSALNFDGMKQSVETLTKLSTGQDVIGDAGNNILTANAGSANNDFLVGLGGIDALYGGQGNDGLRGDGDADRLYGGDGIDFLNPGTGRNLADGGSGTDTLIIDGSSVDFQIEGGATSARVVGANSVDHLFSVEIIQFNDREVVLANGVALQTIELSTDKRIALLYEAGLNRDGRVDKDGLNFWIDQQEAGRSERDISFNFLRSEEFTNSFGSLDSLSDLALVNQLYSNVLNREGEAGGVTFWTGRLGQSDFDRADLLLSFSYSPENQAGSQFISRLVEVDTGIYDFG